ncbi:MAG: hypothetical protein A2521_07705 [Deltaproteobacteria bacterium RIFOXYD12_FULL_57_12]|nr:MAG: hypothetical protein A2521_07705 [Deltaproteobacteria bacterium RIFOXYD12_FULL_57_12]
MNRQLQQEDNYDTTCFWWPESYTAPGWLPNWTDEDEYDLLTSQTEYRFKDETFTDTDYATFRKEMNQRSLETKITETRKNEFAWEFLRRNPYYQLVFRFIKSLTIVASCSFHIMVSFYHKKRGHIWHVRASAREFS